MGVSKNHDTPKSSILIGFSTIYSSILGYPYFWKDPYVSRTARQMSAPSPPLAKRSKGTQSWSLQILHLKNTFRAAAASRKPQVLDSWRVWPENWALAWMGAWRRCMECVTLSGRRGLSRCMVQRVEIQFSTKESRPTVGQEPAQLAQLIVLVPTAQADIVYRIESSPAFKCWVP